MIVIATKSGQLGNRLAHFGNFIGFCIEQNVSLINPSFEEYADYFTGTSNNLFCRYPARKSILKCTKRTRFIVSYLTATVFSLLHRRNVKLSFLRYILKNGSFQREGEYRLNSPEFLKQLQPFQLFFVGGWLFRDHENFCKHGDKIREYFTPLPEYAPRTLISQARKLGDIVVGVHFRGTDFRGLEAFVDLQTCVKCMDDFQRLVSRPVAFLICSDESLDAEDFRNFNYVFGSGHLIEDMYALSECDFIIGPESTFSMWASFYGRVPRFEINQSSDGLALDKFKVVGE